MIGKWRMVYACGYDPENPEEAIAKPFNDAKRPKKTRPANAPPESPASKDSNLGVYEGHEE